METVQSFKGYGKVDPVEDADYKRRTRKRLIVLSISVVLLLAIIIGVVAGTLIHKNKKNGDNPTGISAAIKSVCGVTQYPSSCSSSLSSSNSSDPTQIFQYSLSVVMNSLQKIANFPDEYMTRTDDPRVKEALRVCGNVLDDAVGSINDTIITAKENGAVRSLDDLKTWLSTVVTDQNTCFDALEEVNSTLIGEIRDLMEDSIEFASNSLAIVSKVLAFLRNFKIPHNRRLLGVPESEFPSWVGATERRLLQQVNPKPDVTVAAVGGDVKTITEAVARIPLRSKTRFVIYVKAGEYVGNVLLGKEHWNVMIYGDGAASTIISGGRNFIDGTATFHTPTFAAEGRGFIARDIGFVNTAGAEKHQAVAFRSGSDQSVMYRCSFDGYQDTLYPHSNRQFYRECNVTGTIDFIFGNAAVVFQNCNILPRQPMPNQFVTITAQGKKDPAQNTGISIQRCIIKPLDNLTAPTYLGRPWKDFSTTVIMQSDIGGFLNPLGWIEWVKGVDPPKTIFYGEYQNTGPGSITTGRVKWAGFNPMLPADQASKFNVDSFIQGPSWLPESKVVFEST